MITVLIATPNSRRGFISNISRAIRSVQNQAAGPIRKIVVVNDHAAPVNPPLGRLAIEILNTPYRIGLAAALNIALRECDTEWVMLVSDYTELHPNHTDVLWQCVKLSGSECAFSDVMIDDGTRVMTNQDFSQGAMFSLSGCLIKRQLLRKIGGFDESIAAHWDLDAFLSLAKLTSPVASPFPSVNLLHQKANATRPLTTHDIAIEQMSIDRVARKHGLEDNTAEGLLGAIKKTDAQPLPSHSISPAWMGPISPFS